ncbi:Integral membrane protein [hydrothermal vent metagenome]|uniref:Integral membrane protein n=1 Tax=hydrothermal vent metagenome TaxID=652676 RepID=A0A3B0ZRV6_9ZZZZ
MDVLSQAVLGASLSQSVTNDKARQWTALLIGALAGMAPDLDVLIRSADDPLLFLEFHRQFTHSLLFIPLGALLLAMVFYPFVKTKLTFAQSYLFSFSGLATHGLLDACTSYGTQLFWPFSNERVAWNIVSIVDPLFTIPVLVFIVLAVYRKQRLFAQIAFVYAVVFLSLGFIQKHRAEDALYSLAEQRGHEVERMRVKPSFANRHVWKLIYEYKEHYYVDAVKLLSNKKIIPGTSIQKLNVKRDLPWLTQNSKQAKDIERFRWFSDDFLAIDPQNPNTVMDVRYSLLPNNIKLMWGIKLKQPMNNIPASHVKFIVNTQARKQTRKQFIDMLF